MWILQNCGILDLGVFPPVPHNMVLATYEQEWMPTACSFLLRFQTGFGFVLLIATSLECFSSRPFSFSFPFPPPSHHQHLFANNRELYPQLLFDSILS